MSTVKLLITSAGLVLLLGVLAPPSEARTDDRSKPVIFVTG